MVSICPLLWQRDVKLQQTVNEVFCDIITSAVTSRRLIVTSYNLVITRFWYPATNNRYSVFTGSNHHVFMKIPVLETPSFLHLPLWSCRFVCLECKSWVFVILWWLCASLWWHPTVCTQQLIWYVCVVSLTIPLSLITIIRHGFEITRRLFG